MNGKKARGLRKANMVMVGMTWRQTYRAMKKADKRNRHAQAQDPKFAKARKHKPGVPHTCLRVGRIPGSTERRVWREMRAMAKFRDLSWQFRQILGCWPKRSLDAMALVR
jgi:hypothetical protein